MAEKRAFFYSPFSPSTVGQGVSPRLLIQIIVHELKKGSPYLEESDYPDSPFAWTLKPGTKNKVEEHAQLLKYAFPELGYEAEIFVQNLHLPCAELLALLEPFVQCSH